MRKIRWESSTRNHKNYWKHTNHKKTSKATSSFHSFPSRKLHIKQKQNQIPQHSPNNKQKPLESKPKSTKLTGDFFARMISFSSVDYGTIRRVILPNEENGFKKSRNSINSRLYILVRDHRLRTPLV